MAGILNISEAVSLAMHSMALLAAQENPAPVSTKEMARVLDVSDNHLSKVVQRLVKAGLAGSTRGPRGGVTLLGNPQNLTLMNIYEAIEGKFEVKTCMLKNRMCKPGNCIFGDNIAGIDQQVRDYLNNTTLKMATTALVDYQVSDGHLEKAAGI